tara:strand:+ start:261 stop:473 length:213 start_codon:yes stop_codon:yes gene_type:complete
MENIDFTSNEIEEVKNASAEVKELRFKYRFLSINRESNKKHLFVYYTLSDKLSHRANTHLKGKSNFKKSN